MRDCRTKQYTRLAPTWVTLRLRAGVALGEAALQIAGMSESQSRGPTHGERYWEVLKGARPSALWRRYSDGANGRLLENWLPSDLLHSRVLKTDLFDEAWTGGFCDAIRTSPNGVVMGIDASLAIAQAAATRRPDVPVVVADVRALPFRRESFDLVLSPSTLDHFDERESIEDALMEVYRTLAPGGVLLVSLDNPLNPLIALRNRSIGFWRRVRVVPYFMGVTLGPGALEKAAAAVGFEPLRRGAIQHFPRVVLVALERLGVGGALSRLWLTVAGAFEVLGHLPTRYLTGQFVATLQRKPSGANAEADQPNPESVQGG